MQIEGDYRVIRYFCLLSDLAVTLESTYFSKSFPLTCLSKNIRRRIVLAKRASLYSLNSFSRIPIRAVFLWLFRHWVELSPSAALFSCDT